MNESDNTKTISVDVCSGVADGKDALSSYMRTQIGSIIEEIVRERVARIMGDREATIKQAWRNGYNKGVEDTLHPPEEQPSEVLLFKTKGESTNEHK